jgi:hypothetical protein
MKSERSQGKVTTLQRPQSADCRVCPSPGTGGGGIRRERYWEGGRGYLGATICPVFQREGENRERKGGMGEEEELHALTVSRQD